MCSECSKCPKCSIKVRLPYRVLFYLKSPIFILQRAYIPKNGVEFRQQTNSDNRTGVATSRVVADLPSLGVTGLIVYFSDFHTLRGEVWKIHCQTCHTLWGEVWHFFVVELWLKIVHINLFKHWLLFVKEVCNRKDIIKKNGPTNHYSTY